VVDGVVDASEWEGIPVTEIPHGLMMAKHDANTLYLLLDVIDDTTDDPLQTTSPFGDYFELVFDSTPDGVITPNADVMYGLLPAAGVHNLGLQYFLAPSTWTPTSPTVSQLGAGFGPSIHSPTPHRIWEFGIDRNESGTTVFTTGMGVRLHSVQPSFDEAMPVDYDTSFSSLLMLRIDECNQNGTDDAQDISSGASDDCNGNAVPDECEPDVDGDGVTDACDNCPDDHNPDQADGDANGMGDACDGPGPSGGGGSGGRGGGASGCGALGLVSGLLLVLGFLSALGARFSHGARRPARPA
jgi:hypothetical protein